MLALLLSLTPAHALTSMRGGPALDLYAGLGLEPRPSLGAALTAHAWRGRYDDDYAFGRYWSMGVTGRVDWRPGQVGLAPLLELRRGVELFVAGVAPFVGVGPAIHVGEADEIGVAGRAGVHLKVRRTRTLGASLRLEGGVDWVGAPAGARDELRFAGGLLLGVAWARPADLTALEEPAPAP